MKTHEVEKMLCISKQALIYYEKAGMIEPSRDDNDYRNYSQKDIEVLKLILLLRSMDISIEEIKAIIKKEKTIRTVLETKKDIIKRHKIELEDIDKRINEFIKREEVKVYINKDDNQVNYFDKLCLNPNDITYQENKIVLSDIKNIRISISSSLDFMRGIFVFFNYYIDIDIDTNYETYSFQIMNKNKETLEMFDYFIEHSLPLEDPMELIKIYHEKQDIMMLNKYLDLHFREWAKEYHLDNPRKKFWDHIEDYKKYWGDMKNNNR